MREHKSNQWITIVGLAVVVVVIIAGIITISRPLLTYKSDMYQSLEDLNNKDALFYPRQLNDLLNNKMKNIVLFDIRDDYIFSHGHIPGAENIQAEDLSKKDFIKRLEKLKEENISVVLYGDDQLQANGPWMLFRQVGFSNVKMLLGGYQYYIQHQNDMSVSKADTTLKKGVPRYDFAEMAAPKNGAILNVKNEKKTVEIRRRKKTTTAAGGC
jgi:3-mercaptopyruvate sulfurtransferase SseA